MKKHWLRWALFMALLKGSLFLLLLWGYQSLGQPVLPGQTITFQVHPGESQRHALRRLAQDIEQQALVWLPYYARIAGPHQVKVGLYRLDGNQSALQWLAVLAQGQVQLRSLTVVEGSNRWQVEQLLADQGWMSREQFQQFCDDEKFLQKQGVPGPTCEGYLFPETYQFAVQTPAEQIFATMIKGFLQQYKQVMEVGAGPLALPMQAFVTLASIVEKETGAAKERPHIACVFYNRLQAKPPWRLQTDPTVMYAAKLADPQFDGNIRRWHLEHLDSPYNTYRHFDLPPGPIANPGKAALLAVAQPLVCKDMFFVSTNAGEHVFCPDLACHEQAVQRYQVQYFRQRKASLSSVKKKATHPRP